MDFTIADGTTKAIVAGSKITINDDFTPGQFSATAQFSVSKIAGGYPFVVLTRDEKWVDLNGVMHDTISEEVAVSPQLITGVIE